MNEDYAEQLTAIYNQLSQINAVLANLATLSFVNTVQGDLQTTMNSIYSTLGTLQQQAQQMDQTVSSILVSLRST